MEQFDRNTQFDLAFRFLSETSRSIFLTGKAGTGKTTFLRKAVAESKKEVVVLAPTGIAALNAGGQTLHSFFRLPFQPFLLTDIRFMAPFQQQKAYGFRDKENIYSSLSYTANHIKAIESVETIIIDEISMVRADILDMIDRILKVYRKQPRKPFGGVQMVLIGDPFQLPPVLKRADREILKDIYPEGGEFFTSHIFQRMAEQQLLLSIELKKVYRQNDDRMVGILNRLREGKHTHSDICLINTRCKLVPEVEQDGLVELAALNREAEKTNRENLAALEGTQYDFEGLQKGEINIKDLPCEAKLELKEGAQVVFIRNHSGGDYVNGTVGKVISLNASTITVAAGEKEIEVEHYTWENAKYTWNAKSKKITKELRGSYSQYPIKLAWAITVHKSQGLSLNKALLNLDHSFTYGQVYVALSRCRTWEGMFLKSPLNTNRVKTDPRVIRFMEAFPEQEALMQSYLRANAEYYYNKAWLKLRRGDLKTSLAYFRNAIEILPLSLEELQIERLLVYLHHRRNRLQLSKAEISLLTGEDLPAAIRLLQKRETQQSDFRALESVQRIIAGKELQQVLVDMTQAELKALRMLMELVSLRIYI